MGGVGLGSLVIQKRQIVAPMSDTNDAKRKAPKTETLRELYLVSGNVCAFPGCDHRIIDDNGIYVADLCHIEAAEEGGERFNPNMTNEERRAFANLMLMCGAHHRVTNNESEYPVAKLRAMKSAHEAKFRGVVAKIAAAFADKTKATLPTAAQSLAKVNRVLKWNHGSSELREVAAELAQFLKRLAKVPLPTRELLEVIVERADGPIYLSLGVTDLVHAVEKPHQEVHEHLRLLERHGMISIDEVDDANINVRELDSGWPIWSDVRKFAGEVGIPLSRFVIELRYDEWDE